MGLGAQMIAWDQSFCVQLAERGRRVVRFDNRDIGLSSRVDAPPIDILGLVTAALSGGNLPEVPYLLTDMAADAIGLLDHLGVQEAHVVGASMGGMIVQTMAIEHADRLLSATSIMSTVGDPEFGQPQPAALTALLTPPPTTRDEAIQRSSIWRVIGSKRYYDRERMELFAGAAFDRSPDSSGTLRQLAATLASGDRTELLRHVTVPTLVVHGLDDTLIDPSGGRRTAELLPGAHLLELADMGHDMPPQLWPILVNAIIGHGDAAARERDVEVAA
jgi:pimeloyl-ACP methyl ester carboxylesterase